MKGYRLLIILFCFLCVGCSEKKEVKNKLDLKNEYEKYNDSDEYIDVEILDDGVFYFSTKEEVNKLIKNGTGVVFFGDAKDNVSRLAVSVLSDAIYNSANKIDKVYYLDDISDIDGLENITNIEIPLVLFVVDGKIVQYHVGTINNLTELTKDERVLLHNTYTGGLEKVLGIS